MNIVLLQIAEQPKHQNYKAVSLLDYETFYKSRRIYLLQDMHKAKIMPVRLGTLGFALACAAYFCKSGAPFYVRIPIRGYRTKREYHKIIRYVKEEMVRNAYKYLPDGFPSISIQGIRMITTFTMEVLIMPEESSPEGIGEMQMKVLREDRKRTDAFNFFGRTMAEKARGILWLLQQDYIEEFIVTDSKDRKYYFYELTEKGYAFSRTNMKFKAPEFRVFAPKKTGGNGFKEWKEQGGLTQYRAGSFA